MRMLCEGRLVGWSVEFGLGGWLGKGQNGDRGGRLGRVVGDVAWEGCSGRVDWEVGRRGWLGRVVTEKGFWRQSTYAYHNGRGPKAPFLARRAKAACRT